MTLALTLGLVATLGYVEMTRLLERRVVQQEAVYQQGQAQALEAIARGHSWSGARGDINTLLDVAARRPGALEALLIDSSFRVVDSPNATAIGRRNRDPRIAAALSRRVPYAGRESEPSRDSRDFEFVTPLNLPGGRFVLDSRYDHKFFDEELSEIRRSIALVTLIGLLIGGLAFYLLGGRSLIRTHKHALARATHDGLTDLENQPAFQTELDRAATLAARHGEPLSLALIDVDDFKFFNDRHGHRRGDELLLTVAAILREGRTSDRAFRIGGDEFALLLPRTDVESANVALRRLRGALAESGAVVSVGLSVRRPGADSSTLHAEADAALLEAKRRGGNALVAFDDVRDTITVTSSAKVDALHRLLAERDVGVAFQPIWDLDRSELIGVEALARPSTRYGFSGPAEAFDVAEQIGRVHELDMLCVERALSHVDELPHDALMFINIAPLTLDLDADGEGWLVEAVERSGIDPERVVIEVTERFGGRMASVIKSLERLRAAGLKLALDDVGSGNSGLDMLRQLNVEFVKLDRSLVTGAMAEPGARAVLLAMTTFANQTGAFVIAEGIQDHDTLEFVTHLEDDITAARPHIHGGQGFCLGLPASTIPTTTNELPHPSVPA